MIQIHYIISLVDVGIHTKTEEKPMHHALPILELIP